MALSEPVAAFDRVSAEATASLRIVALERRLQRERLARLSAEAIAEKGMRDLYERQGQLELIAAIAAAANSSATPEQALEYALQAMCDHTGWEVGHVFVLAPSGESRLSSTGVTFARDAASCAGFLEASLQLELELGQGLPGRVWSSGAPAWIDDVTQDANFPRAAMAQACGLHAAFAFPLMVGHDVRGVMEFFHSSPLAQDGALLELASRIGTQLGRVLERAAAQRKLLFEAAHDALTGLPNRTAFSDAVRNALANDGSATVLAIDLDGFKHVNDTLGHSTGDELLQEVAERLRGLQRDALIARLGGDEFAILLPERHSTAAASSFAAEIIERLSQPLHLHAAEVCIGSSVGIACAPDHARRLEELLSAADLALYRAKAEGRSCARVFAPEMRAAAVHRHAQEGELREATLLDQFELHYQPQVRTRDGSLAGAEALLRWRHPERGLQSPSAFMPTLESSVLARQVGEWVIRTACAQAAEWRRRGAAGFRVGVNLFSAQLRGGDLIAVTKAALEAASLPADALEIEISENIILRQDDIAVASLNSLREMGVGIAFDDYGTGYASFSLLKKYPLTRLKIDRSFVAAMCDDPRDAAVVSSVLELGRAFGLQVIAEGVESPEQCVELIQLGCTELQGFLFDKSLNSDEFSAKYCR